MAPWLSVEVGCLEVMLLIPCRVGVRENSQYLKSRDPQR